MDTEQTDTPFHLDSCRLGGYTINRMRATFEEEKHTDKDLPEDLTHHYKDMRIEAAIFQGTCAAEVSADQRGTT